MSVETSISNADVGGSQRVIFAVDDEPMLLELVALVLEPRGFLVRSFRDPTAAVRAFSMTTPPPALVITDYAMHEMNGMDLIREFRRYNPSQKIILVSGTVDESVFRNAPVKPDRFLAKPYEPRELARLVDETIASPAS